MRARCVLATIGLAAGSLGAAEPGVLPLAPPGSDAWQPLAFRSVERTTDYAPLDEGGVRAEARCSASALVLPLEETDLDLARTPVLHWRWRVDRPLAIADERSKGGDDFAARVYVMFRFEPEKASLLERARQSLGRRLFGTEMPGTALNFVWSSGEDPGALWTSPYTGSARLLAVARGAVDDWRSESVDVVEAYRRAFDAEPPEPLALGLMTDADDACQHAVARYADFRFAPRSR
ncbi:MAG: DUF3047 domain-containing protein [Myxococcota bacterium]